MLKDKSALKSWTVWGAVLLAGVQSLEAAGVLAPGTNQSVIGIANAIGSFLVVVGIRRAVA